MSACDSIRQNNRARAFEEYLDALEKFLKAPTKKNKGAVITMATKTDEGDAQRIRLLQQGDEETWAKFLFSLEDKHLFARFKPLSPFRKKLLISAKYGDGFVTLRGDTETFIESVIRGKNGCATYCADNYLVVLDLPNVETAKVIWTGGPNNPRNRPGKAS